MTFLYPAFLFALAAIAVPIILHLVQLRRAKRIEFSNVRFIQASQEVTASQRKLKDLLILLSRILFLIFLVLAFAQPFLPGTISNTTSDKDVSVLIDNSYSMQNLHAERDVSLLTFAVDKARSVLDLFPPSSLFSVKDNNSISGSRFPSASEARFALDKVDYSSNSIENRSANEDGHLFILSDFQKNHFKPSDLNHYPDKMQVHLLPIEAGSSANVYIDSVYLEDAFIRVGGESVLHVSIANVGNEDIVDLPLKLIIDEQQVAALSLDLPAKQTTEAIINFRVKNTTGNLGYITVEDFPVEFDNTYYFILSPSKEIKVVEITDGDGLNFKNLYSKEALFNYTQFTSGSIDYARASSADVILLNGVKDISPALVTTINNYIKAGGTVLLTPPQVNASGYDNLFSATSINAQLTVSTADSKTNLIPPTIDNPFFKGIFAEYDRKMQMPKAVRSLRWARSSEDILKYRGGAPYLSRFDRGNGQIYLMAAPMDEDFNSLVNHALLLPVMYKVAISGYKQEQPLAYTLSDNTIKLPVVQSTKSEGIYKLQKDSLAFIPEQQIRAGNLYLNIPPDLNDAGFYNITLDDKTVGTVAFNYDNSESQLEQYTPDEIRELIGTGKENIHVYDYGDALSVKSEFEKRYFGVKLWKYCLILCLIFLMAEITLIRFL